MDTFASFTSSLDAPARSGAALIPSDVTPLPVLTRAVYIGVAGNLSVELADGDVVAFQNLPAGTILPIRVAKARATGTTAGGLVALW